MSELLKDGTSFDEVFFQAWLGKDAKAVPVMQWVLWNNAPLDHLPRATLEQFFSETFSNALLEDSRSRTYVNALLCKKLSWDEPVTWSPEDPLWELAMASPVSFKRLAWLGAAFCLHASLAQIIDGALVRNLRKELGEDLLQFVLLSGSSSKYSYEPMSTELSALGASSTTIVEALEHAAKSLVEHAFSSKERGLQKRIATKFPGTFAAGFYEAPLPWAPLAEKMLHTLWKEASSWL